MKWVDVIRFGLFFDKKLSKNNKKILTIKKYSDILWQEREKVEP